MKPFYKTRKTKMSPYSIKNYKIHGKERKLYHRIMKQIALCIVIVLW